MLGAGCALGHEGVGIVTKIGSEVTQFKVGDRAGAGYLRNVRLHNIFPLLSPLPLSFLPVVSHPDFQNKKKIER